MRGTEKQIAYANDLIAKMDTELTAIVEMAPEAQKPMWADIRGKYIRIMQDAYAGDVIGLLSRKKESGIRYYKDLYGSVMIGAEPLENKIRKEIYGK